MLSQGAQNGHTFVPKDKLKHLTSDLLEIDIDDIEEAIAESVFDKSLCFEKKDDAERVYLSAFYYAELGVARRLLELGVMDGGGLRPEHARLRLAVGLGANFSREDLQLYLLGRK